MTIHYLYCFIHVLILNQFLKAAVPGMEMNYLGQEERADSRRLLSRDIKDFMTYILILEAFRLQQHLV